MSAISTIIALVVSIPLISFFLATISVFTLPASITSAITTGFSAMTAFSSVIPIVQIGIVLSLTMFFEGLILMFYTFMWVLRFVRGF